VLGLRGGGGAAQVVSPDFVFLPSKTTTTFREASAVIGLRHQPLVLSYAETLQWIRPVVCHQALALWSGGAVGLGSHRTAARRTGARHFHD